MTLLWIVVPALVAVSVASLIARARRRRLARLRSAWEKPVERTRRLDAMAESHASRVGDAASRSLDDRTWKDLDFDHVFAAIDRTHSTLGQHALYHRLRTAPTGDHLDAFEALVTRMSEDAAARERASLALERLQDPHGYDVWWLARPDAVEDRDWFVIFPVLTAVSVSLAAMTLAGAIPPAALLALLVTNVAVRYATDRRIGSLARSFRQCGPIIATAGSLRFLTGDAVDPIIRPLGADVPDLARMKLISRWVNGDPFMLSISPNPLAVAVSEVVMLAYEYLNLALLLDGTGVYFGVRDLARRGNALVRVAAAVGDVDAAISVASFRASTEQWSRPDLSASGSSAGMSELRHPLVEDAVPNSIALPAGRGILVTGSNMSGKSTFLRTVGVNAVLAQTIYTCCAREYRAPVFHVRSCIGRSDDLLSGKSYYVAEVDALLELVRASDGAGPHLFLLDELFRGTNAVERIAAGQAVLLQLLGGDDDRTPHIALAATHDRELVDLTSARFDAYHFGDDVGPDGLTFDHRIKPGPSTTRNALALLRLHGAPDALLTRAAETAALLDRQRGATVIAR